MYDSVFVLVEAFNRIIRKKPDQFRSYTMRRQNGQGNTTAKFLECNTSKVCADVQYFVSFKLNFLSFQFINQIKGWVTQWEHGERIAKNLRKVELEGLTGDIRFSDEGKRINYTLHVVEMTVNSAMVKVAEWSDTAGIMPVLAKYTRIRTHDIEKNKTYIITSTIEEPFMMLKQQDLSGKVLDGNDKYEGYCKDLADLIAKQLDINCKRNALEIFSVVRGVRWLMMSQLGEWKLKI